MTKRLSWALICLFCSSATPALAQAVRSSVDVSASADAASNPFLLPDGGSAGSATIRVDPSIVFEDERGQTTVTGGLRYTQYTNRYGGDEAAQLNARTRRALDEKTQVVVGANFLTSRAPLQDDLAFGLGDLLEPEGVENFEVSFLDPTVIGTRTRTTRVGTNFAIERALNPVSSIALALQADYTGFDGAGIDYRQYAGQLGYARRLSERTVISLIGEAGRIDYLDQNLGDSLIASPYVEVEQQLSQTMFLSASAGLSFVSTEAPGDNRKSTLFSGSVRMCDRGPKGAVCFSASRSAQATALGAVSQVTSLGVNYDLRMTQDQRISVSARYSRTGTDFSVAPAQLVGGRDLVGAEARYSKKLTDRLSMFVGFRAISLWDDAADRDPNFTVSAGITIRIGSR